MPSPVLLLALGCTGFFTQDGPTSASNQTERDSNHVRVISWNIEDVGSPGSQQYRAAADILRRLDGDVVALTEVEGDFDEGYLHQLADELGYDHRIVAYDIGFGEDRGAVLSRIPFRAAGVHDAQSLSDDSWAKDLTRAIPFATIDTPTPLTILATHLKSGGWRDEQLFRRAVDGERLAQAASAIPGFDPDRDAVVVTGDFNAEHIDPDGPTTWWRIPSGMPSSYELGFDLQTQLSDSGIAGHPFVPLEDLGFDDSGARHIDGRWWTRPASRKRLDYLFATPAARLVDAEVYNCDLDHLSGMEKVGSPLAGSTCEDAADHLPVFADYDVGFFDGGGDADTDVDTDTDTDADTDTDNGDAGLLVINEIHADPDLLAGDANCDGFAHVSDDEFIEFVNIGPGALDLAGVTVSDAASARHVFPTGTTLEAGDVLVVYGGGDPVCAGVPAQTASSGGLGLSNGGDDVWVTAPDGHVLATASYGSEGRNDVSLTRSTELDDTSDWVLHSAFGSLFSPGTQADGSPFVLSDADADTDADADADTDADADADSDADTDTDTDADADTDSDADTDTDASGADPVGRIILHEVLADPNLYTGDANCDGAVSVSSDEFIELFNTSTDVVDLGGVTIEDAANLRHTFPPGTTLEPGGFAVVFGGGSPACGFDASTASTGALGLSNGGDTVTLRSASGDLVDSLTYGSEAGADTALTRDPQRAAGAWVVHTNLGAEAFSPGESVGSAQPPPAPGTILLAEILADPGAWDGDANCDGTASSTADEFVELHNPGGSPFDLSGAEIQDAVGIRHVFPTPTLVAPGERLVVYGGGVPSCGFESQVASSGALGLNNGGDTVVLIDSIGTVLDSHVYSSSPSDASMVREVDGDIDSAWVDHTTVSGQPHSAGQP